MLSNQDFRAALYSRLHYLVKLQRTLRGAQGDDAIRLGSISWAVNREVSIIESQLKRLKPSGWLESALKLLGATEDETSDSNRNLYRTFRWVPVHRHGYKKEILESGLTAEVACNKAISRIQNSEEVKYEDGIFIEEDGESAVPKPGSHQVDPSRS